MGRKLQKAIKIVDFWDRIEAIGEFVNETPEDCDPLRNTEEYDSYINRLEEGKMDIYVKPKVKLISDYTEEEKQEIISEEIVTFKLLLVMGTIEDHGLKLNKKDKQKFHDYLIGK